MPNYRFKDPDGITHLARTYWSVMTDCGSPIIRPLVGEHPRTAAIAWRQSDEVANCAACLAEGADE